MSTNFANGSSWTVLAPITNSTNTSSYQRPTKRELDSSDVDVPGSSSPPYIFKDYGTTSRIPVDNFLTSSKEGGLAELDETVPEQQPGKENKNNGKRVRTRQRSLKNLNLDVDNDFYAQEAIRKIDDAVINGHTLIDLR